MAATSSLKTSSYRIRHLSFFAGGSSHKFFKYKKHKTNKFIDVFWLRQVSLLIVSTVFRRTDWRLLSFPPKLRRLSGKRVKTLYRGLSTRESASLFRWKPMLWSSRWSLLTKTKQVASRVRGTAFLVLQRDLLQLAVILTESAVFQMGWSPFIERRNHFFNKTELFWIWVL